MIDKEQLLKKTKPEIVDVMVNEVAAVDDRRQKQIKNQVESINRLMRGASYDEEMRALHEQLAEAQARIAVLEQENRRMKGLPTPTAYGLGRR